MTGINLNPSGGFDLGKLFSYKIKYNDPVNTALKKYNGNIAEIDWTYASNSASRYEYIYDDLNRLKLGYYKSLDGTTTSDSKYYNEELTYDVNGNIKTLKRNARPKSGLTATVVDNLKYYYENNELSNRMARITDNEGFTANTSGYPGGGATNTYDDNGNMLTMPDKGITYNFLNLPTQITQQNITKYYYRADGTKIKKAFTLNNPDGSNTVATDYLDGFQYSTESAVITQAFTRTDDNTMAAKTAGQEETFVTIQDASNAVPQPQTTQVLQFFATAEGFYDYENFRYIY